MYAERTAAPPAAAFAALRSHLGELSDLLGANPAEERALLRARIQEAQRAMRNAGVDHGLLALLLRNMLVDLAKSPGRFDAGYFAGQLNSVAARIA
jgi:hypothetical protein